MSLLPLGVFIALLNSPSCLDEEERSADRSTQQRHTPMIRGFHERDSNHDGFLTPDELPPAMRANFLKVDADGDGRISLREHISFLSVRKPKSTKQSASRRLWKIDKGLAYRIGDHEKHTLDIYRAPPFDHPKPLVIWIHGGGWRNGSSSNCPITELAEQGFVVASINYRLSQHAIFPAQIHDCQDAVRWLRRNHQPFGIDPMRFGAWGASAGGHLASLLGTASEAFPTASPDSDGTVSAAVQAVCDWYGPVDLLQMNAHAGTSGTLDHDAPDSPESQLLGGPLQSRRKLAELASPLKWISADTPPFLIVHGEEDPLVSVKQSELLHQSLVAAGIPSEFISVPMAKHGGFSDPRIRQRCFRFFVETLITSDNPNSRPQPAGRHASGK